ncbi:chondroitin AC/alginate lyase [Auriculariales sp. MPI-PUGE-AT-0066]|nr:chondroitin AC/alginate lyase [Auriculariales sp. MPI-PUGE-AT-0066]
MASTERLRAQNSSAQYSQAPTGENNPPYGSATGAPARKGTSPWVKFGIPIAILIVLGAVLGGVLGTQLNKNNKASSNSSNGNGSGSNSGGSNSNGGGSNSGGGTTTAGYFPVSTNAYFLPVYPTQDNAKAYVAPTFTPAASASAAWPTETFAPASPQATNLRPDRPRIIAPKYKWDALPELIQKDAYLKAFNDRIIANGTQYRTMPVVKRVVDGGSGILDISREIKMRIKVWAYAYRSTGDTKWLDSMWRELNHAANNDPSDPFGTAEDPWNQGHYLQVLDVAEMTSAFAIAYDWAYDGWNDQQKATIRTAIVDIGLKSGLAAHNGASYGWWTGGSGRVVSGNWNCVCNAGLTLGALAVLGDDTSGLAEQVLAKTIPNANENCVLGPSTDGTWQETPNYWYFGTTGHAELTSALVTATGSDMGLLTTNKNFNLTGLYHMYVFGMTSLFDYADHGPNKFSSTANSMMFYGAAYNTPAYQLYQRDRFDAADPWNMFWYDPTVNGAWWNGLALDHAFQDPKTQWASMRSSWTDTNGLFIAMRASKLQGFQAHGDLDVGDFVLDAMGQRWAGELGSGDYLSLDYFTSEDDNATRWLYYRKRTEGQNTILLNGANQIADAADPTLTFGSSGDAQGSSPVVSLSGGSTAFASTDMSTAYGGGSSVVRGIRMLDNRQRVLLQDDISSGDATVMWRMHTNATVSTNGASATLKLEDKTLTMRILSPQNVNFETMDAVRLPGDPALPQGQVDQPNPGVTVVVINVPAGENSIQVLFEPQWADSSSSSASPPSVPVAQWSLTSHNT